MSAKRHLRAYDNGRAVGRLEADQSVTTVAAEMCVSKSVTSRYKKAAEGGNAFQNHSGDRGRNTAPLEYRYAALVAERNRNLIPGQIAANLAIATGSLVGRQILDNPKPSMYIGSTFTKQALES
ncbi:hypothetical protein HNY73_021330 [Argiope bruennichi]|uniref:Uncharacterized protein n=1 Tax=Argiope bruennichi TaxID=94029 RepID=A0A8T0DZB9_ARGBR|nr:hypothetical protein HNY73_021330 [Argiope bruennichi]